MRVNQLFLRCFAKYIGNDQWVGICLELNLAVQASSVDEIKSKLESMIKTYVRSALEEDREYIEQLLNRKAPLGFYLEYYKLKVFHMFHMLRNTKNNIFFEALPLKVA